MRVYVATPVPSASDKFRPSKIMRWAIPEPCRGVSPSYRAGNLDPQESSSLLTALQMSHCCGATQFSWTAPARLSRVVPRQEHSIRITVKVGMRQVNLASAAAAASHGHGRGCSGAPVGSGLIEVVAGSRERSALAALLPDFTIGARVQRAEAGRVSGIVVWSRSRHQGLARRRAAALGAPCLLLGTG